MTTITLGKPVGQELRRKRPDGVPRPADAGDAFYVTQQFDDLDFYWSQADPAKAALRHRATDIGNAACGFPLLAMARGRVTHHVDNATAFGAPTNAICSRLDVGPGSGLVIDYWHCARHLVANGATVAKGTPVASVGRTGLGVVCHTHITGRLGGVLIDIEPAMFGAAIDIGGPAPSEEIDMRFGGAELKVLDGARDAFVLTVNSNLRAEPTRAAPSLGIIPKGTVFYATVSVDGELIGDNDQWVPTFQYVGTAYVQGFYHTSVIARQAAVAPEPTVVGVPDEEVRHRVATAALAGFNSGKTKAIAAYTAGGTERAQAVSP